MKKKKRTRPREASIKKPVIGGETWKVFTNPKTQIKHKGKSKRSTEYAFWRIETDNKRVCILTLEHDLVWGNRKLYVNGEVDLMLDVTVKLREKFNIAPFTAVPLRDRVLPFETISPLIDEFT